MNNNNLKLACLLVDDSSEPVEDPFVVTVSKTDVINDLKKEIRKERISLLGKWDTTDLDLWKPTMFLPVDHASIRNMIVVALRLDRKIHKEVNSKAIFLNPFSIVGEEFECSAPHRCSDVEVLVQLPTGGRSVHCPPSKRLRLDESKTASRLWDLTWCTKEKGVPSCTLSPIERDGTLDDDTISDEYTVPSSCWVMKLPYKFGIMDAAVSGILIRDDYIEALRSLFEAAGLDPLKSVILV